MAADTFPALLRDRADRHPDRTACAFLGDGEEITDALDYAGLDRAARAQADVLARRMEPGSRVLVVCEPGLGFVTAFFGCLYAGVAPVPVVPPAPPRLEAGMARLRAIRADAKVEAVLTTPLMRPLFDDDVPVISVDEPGDAGAWRDPGVRAGDVAFLQYTSGSTGNPRGVMLTHGNLLANQRAIAWSLQMPPDAQWVSWLPLYHDMGLIGMLMHPLYSGGTCHLMSPLHFMQRPDRWVRAMSRYGAQVSGSPNFGYELAARRAGELEGLDLSRWQVAYNGAEPIRAATLGRFAETFAPAGLRPEVLVGCYGLAESTLLVSGAWAEDHKTITVDRDALEKGRVTEGSSVTLTCSGRIFADFDVRIVDHETQAELPEDEVGEIWVRGPSVAQGYWRRPEETRAAFGAFLGADGPFLRTGDLGFRHEGRLYVTGRTKDLLIVRGRNVHPHDVEDAAQSAHALARPGGAAAVALDDERVVLVQETTAQDEERLGEVAAAVRQAVLEDQRILLAGVYLVPPRELPKTSSGKLRRSETRRALLAGELTLLHTEAGANTDTDADTGEVRA